MRASLSKPKVVDLFAGAGLLSYAFHKEGFEIALAVEWEKEAATTFSQNLGSVVECEDVRALRPSGRCDVLIAGPPCQGFSTLNKSRLGDRRRSLSLEVARWAKILRPHVIVVENVSGFVGTHTWRKLVRRFNDMSYDVHAIQCEAFNFGVPQYRKRSFTFAFRSSIPVVVPLRFRPLASVVDAWAGLLPVPDGNNNHFAPRPSDLALARMRCIPYGGDKRDILHNAPHLAPPSWWKVSGEATDVWGRLLWDRPSNTLRTNLYNPSKGRYIHPEQHRVISLREAARLHTIPDGWTFHGLHTQISRQIGNSVPPRLGRAIARAVLGMMG